MDMDKRPTISDVAALAGVSKATVSRVMNNVDFVEDETKQRVLRRRDTSRLSAKQCRP